MKTIIGFLRVILGLATPPRRPEDPSGVHPQPLFSEEDEAWFREAEEMFR